MHLTNQLQLPDPLVEAIKNDDYDPGDCEFTTGQLIRPVRINSLTKRYGDQVVEDVADRIFALLGQSIHTILERAGNQDAEHDHYITEKRYFLDFEGTRISGRIDVYDNKLKVLSDYKLCSRYEADRDEMKPEWVQQANINAYIMRMNGAAVVSMNIVAIFRDWSKMMAARKDDYPERQIMILDVPPWPEQKTKEFIRGRIKAHKEGVNDPPLCTPEERWMKETAWSVQKKGTKRAVKLHEKKEQADEHAAFENGRLLGGPAKFYVEERPGENIRCRYYCSVARFCDFGRLILEP